MNVSGCIRRTIHKKEFLSIAFGLYKAIFTDKIPLGRFGEPEEAASAILYLASDEASFITGVVLDVNGGILMA